MESKKQILRIPIAQIIITASVTALLSFIVGLAIFYYTERIPQITYEIFPVSSFPKEHKETRIYSVLIENSGNKEAENVEVTLLFPEGTKFIDNAVKLSSEAIKYQSRYGSDKNRREFIFPVLNPSENCILSFIVEISGKEDVKLGVRGKGFAGVKRETKLGTNLIKDKFILNIVLYTIFLVSLTMGCTFFALYFMMRDNESESKSKLTNSDIK